MCGRFVVARATADLVALFEVEDASEGLPGVSYNIRPTDDIAVVVDAVPKGDTGRAGGRAGGAGQGAASSAPGPGEPVRMLRAARWSLVPPFAKELKLPYPTFNARSETAAEKPSFRASVKSRRCIIPASGYYEWHTEGRTKTPFYVHPGDDGAIAFAGLYSWFRDPSRPEDDPERWVLTATMLTRDSAGFGPLSRLHPRVPVMLPLGVRDHWLDPSITGDQGLVDAMVDASGEVISQLALHEVGPVRGNGPELIAPV